jgi:hypothetical protein
MRSKCSTEDDPNVRAGLTGTSVLVFGMFVMNHQCAIGAVVAQSLTIPAKVCSCRLGKLLDRWKDLVDLCSVHLAPAPSSPHAPS